ncbi:MAG TPA: LysR family transcriptional regulator [Cellvibrionaceae bacterium]|nr:LysR family transcriptional regulator [Cellvibrionaceae bacterium]HMY39398.1 LysR family transcriptional regulator [Marinagarivorans sp.]HNG59915.1 LysR family transcriptional regulator [Cellvibrionaceae bacterium]
MIERHHLALLRNLAHTGSLAAAAEKLHLTQSALTHSIRKLEQITGVTLWEKQGRKLQLTAAGRYLLATGEEVLPRLEAADQQLKALASGQLGQLRIGMECHPCYAWLLKQLKVFLPRWPGVELDVIQRFRFNGREALEQHAIDMLITSDPIQATHLSNIPVFNYALQLIAAQHHPLTQHQWITPQDLADQTLFTFPVDTQRLDVFTQFLSPAGIKPRNHKTLEALEIMLLLVATGRGVCTLPDWLASQLQSEYTVTTIGLGPQGVQKTLYLVVRQGDTAISYMEDFIRISQGGAARDKAK